VRGVYVDDHGDWSHTTVLAETDSPVTPGGLSPEVAEVAWVRIDDLATLALHPGFAASWPAVSAALLGHTDARTTAPGGAPDIAGDPAQPRAPDPGATHEARGLRLDGLGRGTVGMVLVLGVLAGLALLADGPLAVIGAVAAVTIVGWFAMTDVAARVLARWVWPVRITEVPHDRDIGGGNRPDAAELEAELLRHPGLDYVADRPEARPGELSGRDWTNSHERRVWEIRRILRRAPVYLLLAGVIVLALKAEVWLRVPNATPGPLLVAQQRLRSDGVLILVKKFRTLPVGEPLRPSGRDAATRATPVGRILRALSLDELPQILSILRGDMSFVGPRSLLPVDHDLMTSPLVTPAERAHWDQIPRKGLWTFHFPGCRCLVSQSPEYLRTRYLADALYDQIASRRLDEYFLKKVVGPYLRRQAVQEVRSLLREWRGAGPGHGPLGVLTPQERELAHQAFTAVYEAARRPEWHGRAVRNRGPPRAGAEELFSPDAADVRRALERLEATPEQVQRILRAWAYSWRDADGVLVVAVFADRLAELRRLGLLGPVLQHERDDVAGRFADEDAHDRDVEAVWQAIRGAQDATPGPALAQLDELPAGWNATTSAAPIADAVATYRAARRRSIADWTADELAAFAAMPPAAAVATIWAAQGMDGRPGLVTAADRQALAERGHRPIYRGIHGVHDQDVAEWSEQFRTGDRLFVGFSKGYGGSGHVFTTDGDLARALYAERGRNQGVVLAGHLHRDAFVLRHFDALLRRQADVRAAEQRGDRALADLLGDIGAWAALNGVDAIAPSEEPAGDIYLVQNRTAVIVERGPEQDHRSPAAEPGPGGPGPGADAGTGRLGGPAAGVRERLSKLFHRRGPPGTVAREVPTLLLRARVVLQDRRVRAALVVVVVSAVQLITSLEASSGAVVMAAAAIPPIGGGAGRDSGDAEDAWAALDDQLRRVRSELTAAARIAADRLDVEVRVDTYELREARRRMALVRSSDGLGAELLARLTVVEDEIAALERVQALLASWPREGPLPTVFWSAGLDVLAGRRMLPAELRGPVVLLLARSVPRLFARAAEAEWDFTERPRVVEDVVHAVLGAGAAEWFDKRWRRMSRRARLAFAVLVAATDGADWPVELPLSRHSWRGLVDPLRLHTEPGLGELRDAMSGLLGLRPAAGRAQRGVNPRGQFVGEWLDLGQALARRQAILAKLGRSGDADRRLLTTLLRALPVRGPPQQVELLRRVTRHVRRHMVNATGRLFGVQLSTEELELIPGSPLWNALVEYEWSYPAQRALAAYLQELAGTGDARRATRAFRHEWGGWLSRRRGRQIRFAEDEAPADAAMVARSASETVPETVPVLVGANTDPVAKVNLGYPNRHCLDCLTGQLKHLAETVVLHPEIVLLGSWERRPDGSRGDELAQLIVMVTEQGILPLGHPHGGGHLDFGRVFGAYLVEWAMATRLPLLKVVDDNRYYDPDRLTIPGFDAIRPERLEITLPEVAGFRLEMWFDIAGFSTDLPLTEEMRVQRWTPPVVRATHRGLTPQTPRPTRSPRREVPRR
jgi:hypothetical protein